jgi:hypothetical protein
VAGTIKSYDIGQDLDERLSQTSSIGRRAQRSRRLFNMRLFYARLPMNYGFDEDFIDIKVKDLLIIG